MQSTAIPSKFPIPFGNNAGSSYIRPIPEASQVSVTPGAASLYDGFPPLTFIPVGAGGVPPFGQDMNGILNEITAWLQWSNAGGPVGYDATFSEAIGGYPKGALIVAAAGGWWLSSVENNTTDPDTGGAGWSYLSFGTTYAGNPNGNVAGVAAGPGSLTSAMLWDTSHNVLWICTTSGTSTTAVWTSTSASGGTPPYWCGTSAGTANAQTITPPVAMLSLSAGTAVAWEIGAGLTNTGATTLTVGTFGTISLRKDGPTGPVALTGGELVAGNIVSARFDGTYLQLSATEMGTAALANASSNTGTVAAVSGSGGITPGHLATFLDATGTVQDGGPYSSPSGNSITTSGTITPGVYLVDTSAGSITLTLQASITGSLRLIDAKGTWFENPATLAMNGNNISGDSSNLLLNVDGADVQIYFNAGTGSIV